VDACPQRALDAGPIDELIQKYGDVRIIKGGFADPSLTKPNIIFKERVFVGV
jgi:anaerobic dimethyl sulfoxide reductase subunit B (iron-sulfur subunit)